MALRKRKRREEGRKPQSAICKKDVLILIFTFVTVKSHSALAPSTDYFPSDDLGTFISINPNHPLTIKNDRRRTKLSKGGRGA